MGMGGGAGAGGMPPPPAQKVGEERNVTEDGGIKKKLLAAGEGYDHPEAGDEVSVHYTGRLTDGTKFDSSVDRGTPFTFTIGQGQVIKGWDQGVATMIKGEKALLTCTSEYAYGKAGSPPTIPADATLEFEVELLSWKSVSDINGDGSVIKKRLTEGSGWEKPKDMDEVTLRYTLCGADGAEVAASGDEGVEFALSEGHLVAGLASAAANMQVGEKARVTLRDDGARAVGDVQVPAGELTAEVELVGFKAVTKVTPDGGVLRKTLKEGEGYERPNDGATVKVSLKRAGEDGATEVEWRTDEEEALDGLERAVMGMKKGETCLITVSGEQYLLPAAHRPAELAEGEALVYEATLTDFTKEKETWELDTAGKLEMAESKKAAGNELFKAGKMERALKRYEKAAQFIEYDTQFGADEKAAASKIKVSIFGNRAAVALKLQQWANAITDCEKVLAIDALHVKAHFRRGTARAALGDHDAALADFKKVLELDPTNRDARAQYKRVRAKVAEQDRKDMRTFGGMFEKMAAEDATKIEESQSGGEAAEADAAVPEEMAEADADEAA